MAHLSKVFTRYTHYSNSYSGLLEPEFEYLVTVKPAELEGMGSLRRIMQGAESAEVVQAALKFFSLLYDSLDQEIAEDMAAVRAEHLEFCLHSIESANEV